MSNTPFGVFFINIEPGDYLQGRNKNAPAFLRRQHFMVKTLLLSKRIIIPFPACTLSPDIMFNGINFRGLC
jgi:hypothetical protein